MILTTTAVEYVRVPFAGKVAGVDIDPTANAVALAFTAPDIEPVTGDWKGGSWETDPTTNPDRYYGRVIVGTGGAIELPVGTYDVWIRVIRAPETIMRRAGVLQMI